MVGRVGIAAVPQLTSPMRVRVVLSQEASFGTRIDLLRGLITGCCVLFAVYAKANERARQARLQKARSKVFGDHFAVVFPRLAANVVSSQRFWDVRALIAHCS
jgi:hypothetical protein